MVKLNKLYKKGGKKIGVPPGTAVYVGEEREAKVRITLIDYDEGNIEERELEEIEDCFPCKATPSVSWINVDGIHNVDIVEKIGKHFDMHPLIIEDICHTGQRPKMEDGGHYIYIVMNMLQFDEKDNETKAEQVSLVIGENFVISFQEKEGDIFEIIRERIRNGKGRIRKMGPDYLVYALIDAIVDNYFLILEKEGDRIEEMEERVVTDPHPETLQEVHRLKREMIFMRKSVWPLREVVNILERGEFTLIQKSTRLFLRDVYDHTIQVMDSVETFRDMLTGMHDTYLSSISNRMNEIMKVLTIIATIFIPITFIAGVYGMNFEFMPELKWKWAYFIVWGVILAVVVTMLFFFRRKKWL